MNKITLHGASGRMGKALVAAVRELPQWKLVGAVTAGTDSRLGQDAAVIHGFPYIGVPLAADVSAAVQAAEVIVDFSQPVASLQLLKHCQLKRKPVVIGTTGFSPDALAEIEAAARQIPVLISPNMSVGVNLLFALARIAGKAMADADAEIIEAHHRYKVDAPSGTALRLGEVVAQARGTTLAASGVLSREGNTGVREPGSIGFATIRAGEIVGDHTLLLATGTEHLEIRHQAFDRRNFAEGALRAAAWLVGKPAGLYGMDDVLGLREVG
ncbi:4-hydroxy-tetrahydrodipicolinate reductase [Permianibacter sp. IMCC34836]|uniref:4-hydroxy-tetrahydrodipicolinate reductase n=1 Tax=Permianibacter fluminis TaxID=2738515 RepID=UPI0015546C93|nr:4-hydroxy-tetrahydrodipicolinate reductase [Permianibacter fluminis]NQD38992.1 4-hydroxy-tetrahydrodipicolinate reductase [Permianibacter fluminis]